MAGNCSSEPNSSAGEFAFVIDEAFCDKFPGGTEDMERRGAAGK